MIRLFAADSIRSRSWRRAAYQWNEKPCQTVKREALKLKQQLADDFPKMPNYRNLLANSHNNLGYLLDKAGQTKGAEAACREALSLLQQLADDFPRISQYRRDLALIHNNLSAFLDNTGKAKEAEGACREALKLLKQSLRKYFPEIARRPAACLRSCVVRPFLICIR